MNNSEKALPDRLRELRNGKPQAEIARRCGIPQSNYNRYESGTIKPKGDALFKIASFYGLTVDELLSGSKAAVSKVINPEVPSTFETMKQYTDNADALIQHGVEALREENHALRKRVDMLEESFKLIAKGLNHAR